MDAYYLQIYLELVSRKINILNEEDEVIVKNNFDKHTYL